MSYKPTVIPPSILEGRELQKTCNLFINATAQYSEHKRNLKPYCTTQLQPRMEGATAPSTWLLLERSPIFTKKE